MERMLIIGCGDIARRTIPLLKKQYRCFALVRNSIHREWLRSMGITSIPGDLDHRDSLSRLVGLADVVLHLAPPANKGEKDIRTRNLLATLSSGILPKQLIYISTSGVYGDCGGSWVNEVHKLNPQTARAQRRVDAESQVRHWARRNGVKVSILRVPGIYAEDRLPLDRLRSGMPTIVHDEDSYTNHIHAEDLARIIEAVLWRGKANRVYHASDDGVMKMGEYFDVIADAFQLPHPLRITREEAQRVIPESMLSFMNESRKLTNIRMKQELQLKLLYPTIANSLDKLKSAT